ncbi:hypothetical protein Trydic_g14267 [Trypoxylus dichotomus]
MEIISTTKTLVRSLAGLAGGASVSPPRPPPSYIGKPCQWNAAKVNKYISADYYGISKAGETVSRMHTPAASSLTALNS